PRAPLSAASAPLARRVPRPHLARPPRPRAVRLGHDARDGARRPARPRGRRRPADAPLLLPPLRRLRAHRRAGRHPAPRRGVRQGGAHTRGPAVGHHDRPRGAAGRRPLVSVEPQPGAPPKPARGLAYTTRLATQRYPWKEIPG